MRPRRCVAALMLFLLMWVAPMRAMDTAAAANQKDLLWRIAAQEQASLEQRGIVLQDASLSNYLQHVVERLWKQVDTDLEPPVVQVIMDTRMEAFAYPNGYCFLTSGILLQIENEDQLAMILAHEMVHYARQHTARLYNHLHNPEHDTGLQYADHSPVGSAKDVAKKIDAAEYQADCQGLSILKGAGYCEAEVLTLMSNLMESIRDHGTPEALKKMANRRVTIKTLIGQEQGELSSGSAAEASSERYLTRIAPALMANAQAALQRGDWKQADTSVSKFLDLKPDDARAHYIQGEILRRQNDGDRKGQCLGAYEKALEIDPTFPLVHRALGEVHFKAGRYQEARPYFKTFLSLAPHDEAREYIKGYLRQCQE